MAALIYLAVGIAGYLLGSVPTGFLVARARGVDIRTVGSGNIGATNVLRNLGKPTGVFVLLVDVMKGVVACVALPRLAGCVGGSALLDGGWLAALAGLAAILGHNYTCWLRFKGGKGIATTAGVLAVEAPVSLGLLLGVWLIVFWRSRYVSVASISAALAMPFLVWGTGSNRSTIVMTILVAALTMYKHESNIRRLCAGTEHRFSRGKLDTAPKGGRR